ncbi:hypothetical protein ACB087_17905 [Vibrio sp. VNB-15]
MNSITSLNEMKHHYKNMKDAYNSNPMPKLDERVAKLTLLRKALIDFSDRICDAMNKYYG